MVCFSISDMPSAVDQLVAFQKRAVPRVRVAIEGALERATLRAPPRLASALRYAVLPGGGWVRPLLTLAVAEAVSSEASPLSLSAAAAVELLHCASLVHDDMPCFDDADSRRGRPSVHAAFDEPTALLVGDGLIVLAFEEVSEAGRAAPAQALAITRALARAVGAPGGLIAGQAQELEDATSIGAYHDAKTGALFEGAIACGAIAAGMDPEPWHGIGMRLGRAYQIADDIADALGDAKKLGKPVGRDAALGRPNVVERYGLQVAKRRARRAIEESIALVPLCPGREQLTWHLSAFIPRLGLAQ